MSHELLLPGQPLPLAQGAGVRAEEGAFEYADYVVSSCMGYPEISAGRARVRSIKPPLVIPRAESTVRFRRTQLTQVLGRVTRVNPRQATVSILVVDGLPCGGTLATGAGARGNHEAGEGIDGTDSQGIIRAQDVRVTDKDGVVMSECFRPGDIVRATVISLGDARSYYLSTAREPEPAPFTLYRGRPEGWVAALPLAGRTDHVLVYDGRTTPPETAQALLRAASGCENGDGGVCDAELRRGRRRAPWQRNVVAVGAAAGAVAVETEDDIGRVAEQQFGMVGRGRGAKRGDGGVDAVLGQRRQDAGVGGSHRLDKLGEAGGGLGGRAHWRPP